MLTDSQIPASQRTLLRRLQVDFLAALVAWRRSLDSYTCELYPLGIESNVADSIRLYAMVKAIFQYEKKAEIVVHTIVC